MEVSHSPLTLFSLALALTLPRLPLPEPFTPGVAVGAAGAAAGALLAHQGRKQLTLAW